MGDVADSVVTDWIMENVTVDQWNRLRAAGKGSVAVEELQGRINELFIERSLHPNRIPRDIYESTVAELESQIAAAQTDAAIPMPEVTNLGTGWLDMSNADKRTVIGGVIDSIRVLPYRAGVTGRNRISIIGADLR